MLLLALLLLTMGGPLFAQETNVSGTVTDETTGEGIPGVSVFVKGTTTGTATNFEGSYSLAVESGSTLVFSFVGYTPQEVLISNQTNLDVALKTDMVALDEVIAVGYGVQKKKELTGAVAQVKSEEMTKIAASDFTKALQGQVAGVSVIESSGRPGDQANIQIRGLGSISSNTQPLYVVDGIPYNSNPNIPSEDIATVDILKDGAAAAVYGTRASNGVILITTKRGKAGETKVSMSAYYGIQNITSGTELLNTPEHLYVDEMIQRSQGANSSILFYNPNAMDYDTDFVGAITNDNAPIQNYNLTLSGGKEDVTFNINTNYFNQDGILRQSGYDRFTTRANATLTKGKFTAFASIGMMHANKEVEPWGLYEFSIFNGPYRKPIGSLETTDNSVVIPGNNPDHVGYLSRLLNQEDNRVEDGYNVAANLKYEIITGLTFQMNLGMNKYNYKRKFWQPQYLVYDQDGDINELGSRKDAILSEDFNESLKYTMENILSYTKSFNDLHNVTAMLGYTIEKTDNENVSVEKRDFISNDVQVFDGGASLTAINGSDTYHRIVGKLARVQYNYAGKYLFSASIRKDGSSNFGSESRYAYFPGASVGWNISDEGFMDNVGNIDNLKLRASYGEVGNQGIPSYLYSAYVDGNIDYVWGPEGSDDLGSGAIQRGYGNPFVQWETNISRNIGVDLLMFDGKLSFSADVYKNDKEDMLLSVLLPASTGTTIPNDWANKYNSKITNVGDMTNKGIELATSYKTRSSSGFSWSVSGTFTKNINEITSLGDVDKIGLQDSKPGSWRATQQDITTYMVPGYEAGAFFLIETDGIIKTEERLAQVKEYQPNAQLGDVIMIDANGDGQINDDDRVYAGSGMADWEAGLIFNANYKGFDFSAQLFYSQGNEVFNGSKLFAYGMNRHKDLYYMWTPQNPTSDIPAGRTNSEHDNWRGRTDYFLEDGSFLRVRNLSLGYTVPKSLVKGIDNMLWYITAQNPFTFTNYEGYDPEIGGNGVSTRGIDKGTYPVTRKFLVGVQVDF
jgi:TonB-linked SusC/RagA family outer membrane protein